MPDDPSPLPRRRRFPVGVRRVARALAVLILGAMLVAGVAIARQG